MGEYFFKIFFKPYFTWAVLSFLMFLDLTKFSIC